MYKKMKTLKDVITVKDVIKKLKELPQDALVVCGNTTDHFAFNTSFIRYHNSCKFYLPNGPENEIEPFSSNKDLQQYCENLVFLTEIRLC